MRNHRAPVIARHPRVASHRTRALACVLRLRARAMSAVFNFKSVLVVVLLFICTSTFLRQQRPSMFREKKTGFLTRGETGALLTCGFHGDPLGGLPRWILP